jgi:hypothetical protein
MEDAVFDFSEKEKPFFQEQIQKINTLMAAMQNAANLVIVQQGLEGQWQIKPDGSGLIKVNNGQAAPQPQG